ncbi:MAG: class I SAM-dependent methyltransferase [Caulobacteraceae bacterium]
MRNLLVGLGIALFIGACAGGAVPGLMMATPAERVTPTSPHIVAALADPRRPDSDRERDVLRHPAEILAFTGVRRGMRVADIGAGRAGYYTRLFAVAVGSEGQVRATNRAAPEGQVHPFAAVAAQYPNVIADFGGYQTLAAPEPYDIIFISQIYHDFFLAPLNLDVPAINRSLYSALRPGGVLVVIDHSALAGAVVGTDPQTGLHRIDQAQVVRELTEAGFLLEEESQVLRNPADDRSRRVFDGDIRGHTDQFVLRFRKPVN